MEWTLRPRQKIPKQFEKFQLNPITSQLLLARNINNSQEIEKFFVSKYENLFSPCDLSGMKEALDKIEKARKKNEIITIFGDYDADGLTSSALLKAALEELGFAPAVYIPDRNKEGYGLNNAAIDFIKSNYDPALIITVDCGISNWKEIEYAKSLDIDVIVTDHHSIPRVLPKNCTVVNPKLPGQKQTFPDLAGVGVAFKLAQACYEKFLPEKIGQLKWFLDLVAIGTIADCVPLTEENRIFAKFGLIVLQKTKRTGLLELIQTARLSIGEKNPPSVENVAFRIGPRLNASGRMDHADLTLNLLLENDPVKARILALEVESKNTERQKVSQEIYNEVKKTLEENKTYKLIVRSGKHWPLGVVGVVAGKLCDEYHCPVFLLREGEKLFEGSGRSIEPFDIVSAVSQLDRHVETYGGHKQAMGLKLKPKKVGIFEKDMLGLIEKEYDQARWDKKLIIDIEIDAEEIDWDLLSEIKKLEPFGVGNREPVFLSRNLVVREIKLIGNGQRHLKFSFAIGKSKVCEGIFWKGADIFSEIKPGNSISAVFYLRSNEWNGNRKLELNIIDIQPVK
ncbi:MAG TPA: single-stranded-DNA-specific exonuclease RecJ [Candidatus Bathyarchaeia archaeon]|nr:single-stranded-DNA-specific exonuclease RecJ [Candidatus Bathyarchaeia archaeon]